MLACKNHTTQYLIFGKVPQPKASDLKSQYTDHVTDYSTCCNIMFLANTNSIDLFKVIVFEFTKLFIL